MKKVIERIVESPGAPNENDLWLNGKVLKKFQNGEWVTISGGGGGSSASDLSDMTDVDISSPSDGDTLVYNATTGKWENGSGEGCHCLQPMIVEGGFLDDTNRFLPNPGSVSLEEAIQHFNNGGAVMIRCENGLFSSCCYEQEGFYHYLCFMSPGDYFFWGEERSAYVHGTIYPGEGTGGHDVFVADDITDSGFSNYEEMFQAVRSSVIEETQIPLYISYENEHGETVTDHVAGYSSDFHLVYTEGDVEWVNGIEVA